MRLNLDRLQPRKPSLFLHTCATIHCLLVHCTCKHGWTLATGIIMDNAQDHHSVQQLQQCSEWHARQSNTKHHLMPSLYGHETWGDKGPHDSKPKHVGPTCSWLAGHKRLVKHVKPPSTRRTHPHYMPKRNSLQLVKIEMTCITWHDWHDLWVLVPWRICRPSSSPATIFLRADPHSHNTALRWELCKIPVHLGWAVEDNAPQNAEESPTRGTIKHLRFSKSRCVAHQSMFVATGLEMCMSISIVQIFLNNLNSEEPLKRTWLTHCLARAFAKSLVVSVLPVPAWCVQLKLATE